MKTTRPLLGIQKLSHNLNTVALLFLLLLLTTCKDDDDEKQTNTNDPNKLEGLYGHWNVDVLGYCGGLCWEVNYFFPDGKVLHDIENVDDLDWENPVCKGNNCKTYEIKNNQLIIEGEVPKSFSHISDRKIKIGNSEYDLMEPQKDLKLNALYNSYSYVSNPDNTGGAGTDIYLDFKSDGSYKEKGIGFGFNEDVTAIGNAERTGQYKINQYSIEFMLSDGKKEKVLFFLPEGRRNDIKGSPAMVHIGTRDYLQED